MAARAGALAVFRVVAFVEPCFPSSSPFASSLTTVATVTQWLYCILVKESLVIWSVNPLDMVNICRPCRVPACFTGPTEHVLGLA